MIVSGEKAMEEGMGGRKPPAVRWMVELRGRAVVRGLRSEARLRRDEMVMDFMLVLGNCLFGVG